MDRLSTRDRKLHKEFSEYLEIQNRPREANLTLVRVLSIQRCSGQFHNSAPERMTFLEYDWFHDEAGLLATEEGREQIKNFILQKQYAKDGKPLLILNARHSMTINYPGG